MQMKQQIHDKLNVWRTRKKSQPQMRFEPKTLRDLVGCSNHWATGDLMVSKGQFMCLDWNHITRLHSQVSSCVPVITWLCSRVMRFQSRLINWPLLTIGSPVAQWLEHPTRSRRVVGSNPIWGSDFFRVLQTFKAHLHDIHFGHGTPKFWHAGQ